MSTRSIPARMAWHANAPTDVDGVVVWWTRMPGNRLAEVHHLKDYRGRLRIWEQRGHGALVHDEPVHISRDAKNGPEASDVLNWQAMLRAFLRSTTPSPSAQVGQPVLP